MSDDWLKKPSADAPEDPPTQAYGSTPASGTENPYGQQPYGDQAGYDQASGGQPGAAPYNQPHNQPYAQQYGQPYASGYQPAYGYQAAPPSHPSANTALVLGLVSLIGGFVLCGVAFVVGPFAWSTGRKAMREIDANPALYGGRGSAQAGMIMGIISTVLLVLGVIAVIGFFVLIAIGAATSNT